MTVDNATASPARQRSAARTLARLARLHRARLCITFAIVALENGLLLAYPLFAGFAINAIINADLYGAASYAFVVLAFWVVGALRRAVDTRTFSRIYAGLAVDVVLDQRAQGQSLSTLAARVVLAREFVDFFEKHMPLLTTTATSMFGAAIVLTFIEPVIGAASCLTLCVCLFFMPRFARKNESLHERLNDRLEKEVHLLGSVRSKTLLKHYLVISKLRVSLSDREAVAYIMIGLCAAVLFGMASYCLATTQGVQAGHVYSVMTYLWTFVMSLDETPALVDQLARLRNIGKRVSSKSNGTEPGS